MLVQPPLSTNQTTGPLKRSYHEAFHLEDGQDLWIEISAHKDNIDDREMETVLLLLMMSQKITKDQLLNSLEKRLEITKNKEKNRPNNVLEMNHLLNSDDVIVTKTHVVEKNRVEPPFKKRKLIVTNSMSSNVSLNPMISSKKDEIKSKENMAGNHHSSHRFGEDRDDRDYYYPRSLSSSSRIKKRQRTSPEQLRILEDIYTREKMPNQSLRESLAKQLGMTSRRVQIWFQNKRAKEKRLKGKYPGSLDSEGRGDSLCEEILISENVYTKSSPYPPKFLFPPIIQQTIK